MNAIVLKVTSEHVLKIELPASPSCYIFIIDDYTFLCNFTSMTYMSYQTLQTCLITVVTFWLKTKFFMHKDLHFWIFPQQFFDQPRSATSPHTKFRQFQRVWGLLKSRKQLVEQYKSSSRETNLSKNLQGVALLHSSENLYQMLLHMAK